MKLIVTVCATVLLLASCGDSSPDFTVPSTDFSFRIQCESQARGLPTTLIFEEEFESMQRLLTAGETASLNDYQSTLLSLLSTSEPTTIDGATFTPQRVSTVFEAGTATVQDLLEQAGVREVQLLALFLALSFYDERESQFIERYDDSLNGHCDSFFEEDIRAACEAGDGTSCFRVNRIERRDFDIIAEACELAPYMLLCEPEDPPPYDLPRINES